MIHGLQAQLAVGRPQDEFQLSRVSSVQGIVDQVHGRFAASAAMNTSHVTRHTCLALHADNFCSGTMQISAK